MLLFYFQILLWILYLSYMSYWSFLLNFAIFIKKIEKEFCNLIIFLFLHKNVCYIKTIFL